MKSSRARRSRILRLGCATPALVAACLSVGVVELRAQAVGFEPAPVAVISARAPEASQWRLRGIDGTVVSFSEFRGRPVVLNVWATWCLPCVAELGSLASLSAAMQSDPATADVAFILLAPETARQVSAFAAKHRLNMPLYVELDAIPESLGVRALPTTIVFDAEGRVVLRHRGAANWDTPEMRKLLAGLAR